MTRPDPEFIDDAPNVDRAIAIMLACPVCHDQAQRMLDASKAMVQERGEPGPGDTTVFALMPCKGCVDAFERPEPRH